MVMSSTGIVARANPRSNVRACHPFNPVPYIQYSENHLPIPTNPRGTGTNITESGMYTNISSLDVCSFLSSSESHQGLSNQEVDSHNMRKQRLKDKISNGRYGGPGSPLSFSSREGNCSYGDPVPLSSQDLHYQEHRHGEGYNGSGYVGDNAHEEWFSSGFPGRGVVSGGVASGEIPGMPEELRNGGMFRNEFVSARFNSKVQTSAVGMGGGYGFDSAAVKYGYSASQGDANSFVPEEEAGPMYNDPLWSQGIMGIVRDACQQVPDGAMRPDGPRGLAGGMVPDGLARPFSTSDSGDYEAAGDSSLAQVGQQLHKATPPVNNGGLNVDYYVPEGNLPLPPPMLVGRASSTHGNHDQSSPSSFPLNEQMEYLLGPASDVSLPDDHNSDDIMMTHLPQDGELDELGSPGAAERILRQISADNQDGVLFLENDSNEGAGLQARPTSVQNPEDFIGSAEDNFNHPIDVQPTGDKGGVPEVSHNLSILTEDAQPTHQSTGGIASLQVPRSGWQSDTSNVIEDSLGIMRAMKGKNQPLPDKAMPSPGVSLAPSSYNSGCSLAGDRDSSSFSSSDDSLYISSVPSASNSLEQPGDLYLESTGMSVSSSCDPDSSVMDTSSPSIASCSSTYATDSINESPQDTGIFHETHRVISERQVWNLSIRGQILMQNSSMARSIPFLRKLYFAWKDCLVGRGRPSLGDITSRCAELCDTTFDVEKMAISIQIPLKCEFNVL